MSAPRLFVRLFKPQFAPLVEAGTKLQTVRPTPKRMPRAGDKISLRTWAGLPYRSKQRSLRESFITEVAPVTVSEHGVYLTSPGGIGYFRDSYFFARADGFCGWPDMLEWFRKQHGLPFTGIVIFWK